MVVAVTGATGFAGRFIVEHLLRREHGVRALVRRPEKAGWLRDRGGVELVALITRKSFAEMGLAVGSNVYAAFKSVAIRIF